MRSHESMFVWLGKVSGVLLFALLLCLVPLAAIAASPNDLYFNSRGTWGQSYDDQWALKNVGLDGESMVWKSLGHNPKPVVVAVIDTGLDWYHRDFSPENLWFNGDEIPENGKDDDNNGYVDDLIGWDFFANSNRPWDYDGHGTFVTGIIAATRNNGVGIAGINPYARIMVLKAINNFGHSRASFLAEAIAYAVDNGARIINVSVGGPENTRIEKAALDYAAKKGVLVVVAAGNEGSELDAYGPATHPAVLTVAATGPDGKRVPFSNWGPAVSLAAPGVDILSLRARRTDTMRDAPGLEYKPGSAYVGKDKQYYRASGTSFSAPIVTGIASLLLSKSPDLSAEDLRRVLLNSASDIDTAGIDQTTGYGLVDARKALAADPQFFVSAAIDEVGVVAIDDGNYVRVTGTADADRFRRAWVELGAGENPNQWKKVSDDMDSPVRSGTLADIGVENFQGATEWTIRLVTEHQDGTKREIRFQLSLG